MVISVILIVSSPIFYSFFFNDTATTEIYTLSLHDALPISGHERFEPIDVELHGTRAEELDIDRSEEHTSELQSRENLVCRLLLEKKKKTIKKQQTPSKTD